MSKVTRLLVVIGLLALLIIVVGGQASYVKAEPTFPESHRDFLGATSYAALFGNAATTLPQFGRPATAVIVGRNKRVNDPQEPFPDGLLGRSETTIAASTFSGKEIVVGWNDAEGFCGPPFNVPCTPPPTPGLSGYGFSSNFGGSFTDGGAPPLGNKIGFGPGPAAPYATRGDPALDVGATNFYYANLATYIDPDITIFGDGVSVHTGRFNGKQFSWFDAVLLQSPNYPNDFLDKEFIAVDGRAQGDRIYVSVTNFIEVDGEPFFGFGQIEAYFSLDGGSSWNRSIIQPDETVSVPDNTGVVNQGSMPAVSPDETLYVAWERGWLFPLFGGFVTPEIRVARSTDNGSTWTPAAPSGPPPAAAGVLVSKICSGALFPPVGYNRETTNDFPRIAVAQRGPHAGRVYVVWHDCRIANGGTQAETGGLGHPDTDVFLSFSDDRGATWSDPVLVAGGGDGKIQFWPTVSVDPVNGRVDITYYESNEVDLDPQDDAECVVGLGGEEERISPVSSLVDLFYARSNDGGVSFGSPVRVSEVTTNWCETATNIIPNFGDYNTAVSLPNRVLATWADGRNGVPDTFFATILTDK